MIEICLNWWKLGIEIIVLTIMLVFILKKWGAIESELFLFWKKIKEIYSKIKQKIANFWTKLKNRIERSAPTREEIKKYALSTQNKLLFWIYTFLIAFLSYFIFETLKIIYNENLSKGALQLPLLSIALVIFVVIWFVVAIATQFNSVFQKFFLVFIFYFGSLLLEIHFGYKNLGMAVLILTFILSLILISKTKDKYPNWLMGTIMIMILFFSIGLFLINETQGYSDIALSLNEHTSEGLVKYKPNNSEVWLRCSVANSSNYKITTGSQMTCNLDPNIPIINYSMEFRYNKDNSVYDISNFNVTESFIIGTAKNSTEDILFEGFLNQSGNIIQVSTYHKYKIHSVKELSGREEKYVEYMLILLAAVLFSVPSMMRNLRDLSKKKTGNTF